MNDDPFRQCTKTIDGILARIDSFTAARLIQAYEAHPDKTAFVAVLVGQVLVGKARTGRDAQVSRLEG
jgi:hypothetical protein